MPLASSVEVIYNGLIYDVKPHVAHDMARLLEPYAKTARRVAPDAVPDAGDEAEKPPYKTEPGAEQPAAPMEETPTADATPATTEATADADGAVAENDPDGTDPEDEKTDPAGDPG